MNSIFRIDHLYVFGDYNKFKFYLLKARTILKVFPVDKRYSGAGSYIRWNWSSWMVGSSCLVLGLHKERSNV